jgi:hypothetical protein
MPTKTEDWAARESSISLVEGVALTGTDFFPTQDSVQLRQPLFFVVEFLQSSASYRDVQCLSTYVRYRAQGATS